MKKSAHDKTAGMTFLSGSAKILVPMYFTYLLFALSLFFVFVPQFEKQLLNQKKLTIRHLTDSVLSLLSEYESKVRQNEMTETRAKARTAEIIRGLRYGIEGKDYFWITDMHSFMIMHPYRPDLEGADLSHFQDKAGNYPFVSMVETVKKNQSGYVDYYWQWKDTPGKISAKISYVRSFEPWGWVIGTGLYRDDIARETNLVTSRFIQILIGLLIVIVFISIYISAQVLFIRKKEKRAEKAKKLEDLRIKKLLRLSRMTEEPVGDITALALENAITLTESSIGYLAFLNPDESVLTMHTWSRQTMKECEIEDKTLSFDVKDTGLWALAARTRKAEIINNYDAYTSPLKKGMPRGHVPVTRMALVPVFEQGQMVALAGVGNKKENYNLSDIRQLSLIMEEMLKILQRKQDQEQLKQSEERYRLLADNATDVIWVLDISNGKYIYISPSIKNLSGYAPEEYEAMSVGEDLTKSSLDTAMGIINEELKQDGAPGVDPARFRNMEIEINKKQGGTVWAEATARFLRDENGKPDRILGITRDISQRKSMESRIMQAQKMEALGTLAGGIAHDFNNILSSMMGFTELARLDARDDDPMKSHMDKVLAAGIRARDLVRHILAFSRKNDIQKNRMEIVPLVKECLQFIRASIPADIEIKRDIRETRCVVLADPTQLHQVFMNLLTNAAHAMKDKGGTLTLELDTTVIASAPQLSPKELKPGTYVRILVKDTGCGINKTIQEKIFEPFFTTKARGEGTGMGLAVTYGIVRDMDGHITVYSEPGMGSTFQVLIPEQSGDLGEEVRVANDDLPKGKGRILLLDDEPAIISFMSQFVGRLGYSHIEFTDPARALETFEKESDSVDLIITDLTMPGMSGLDFARAAKTLRPDIPIIISTGFSEDLTDEILEKYGIQKVLMKPIITGDFARVLAQILKE